jgi:hypothetical protein
MLTNNKTDLIQHKILTDEKVSWLLDISILSNNYKCTGPTKVGLSHSENYSTCWKGENEYQFRKIFLCGLQSL